MLGDEPLEVGDDLRVPAEPKLDLEPVLEAGEPQLVQPRCLVARERLAVEVGERLAPPETRVPRRVATREPAFPARARFRRRRGRSNRSASSSPAPTTSL